MEEISDEGMVSRILYQHLKHRKPGIGNGCAKRTEFEQKEMKKKKMKMFQRTVCLTV